MEAGADYARIQLEQDELAKEWLVRIIERTPPSELADLPVDVISAEAPPLISEILRELADGTDDVELAPEGRQHARELGRMRRATDRPSRLPRDLAALQTVLIEALRREVPEREPGAFAESVGRLAGIFGEIQSSVNEQLVEERSGAAEHDAATGLPGSAQFHEWLRILIAEYRRYAHPFALLLIDIDGLARINEAYGDEVGDRMISAVGTAIEQQVRTVDRAFRLAEDEFCVLVPHQVASRVGPLRRPTHLDRQRLAASRRAADERHGWRRLVPRARRRGRAPARGGRGGQLRRQGVGTPVRGRGPRRGRGKIFRARSRAGTQPELTKTPERSIKPYEGRLAPQAAGLLDWG